MSFQEGSPRLTHQDIYLIRKRELLNREKNRRKSRLNWISNRRKNEYPIAIKACRYTCTFILLATAVLLVLLVSKSEDNRYQYLLQSCGIVTTILGVCVLLLLGYLITEWLKVVSMKINECGKQA